MWAEAAGGCCAGAGIAGRERAHAGGAGVRTSKVQALRWKQEGAVQGGAGATKPGRHGKVEDAEGEEFARRSHSPCNNIQTE